MAIVQAIIGREYPERVTPLIESAQQSIDILVFDWRWYFNDPGSRIQKFNQALVDASKRGVKIRALVNNNIVPTVLRESKIKVRRVGTKSMLHAKMIIIDKEQVVIGSHNLSKNAFDFNHELSVLVDDDEVVGRCLCYFNNLCLL